MSNVHKYFQIAKNLLKNWIGNKFNQNVFELSVNYSQIAHSVYPMVDVDERYVYSTREQYVWLCLPKPSGVTVCQLIGAQWFAAL